MLILCKLYLWTFALRLFYRRLIAKSIFTTDGNKGGRG